MPHNDFIHYLAVDILDIAVRCNFSKTGIDAVEKKLREAFVPKIEPPAPPEAADVAVRATRKGGPKA